MIKTITYLIFLFIAFSIFQVQVSQAQNLIISKNGNVRSGPDRKHDEQAYQYTPNHCAQDFAAQIHDAIRKGDVDAIRHFFTDHPNCLEMTDETGLRPLYWATLAGQTSVVKLLLQQGAQVDSRNGKAKYTPLHCAAGKGNSEILTILLDHKADVNATDESGRTALFLAVADGQIETASMLLDRKADVNRAADKVTPLHMAAYNGDTRIVQILIAHGANKKLRNKSGLSPALVAFRNKKYDVFDMLKSVSTTGTITVTTGLCQLGEEYSVFQDAKGAELLKLNGAEVEVQGELTGNFTIPAGSQMMVGFAGWTHLLHEIKVNTFEVKGKTKQRK